MLVQVVDGERGVDLHDAASDPAAQVVAGCGDGVAVQRDADAHLALDIVLDGVQNLVVLKRIALAGHLHVGAGKLATGAVVVHHQVVRAQDLRIRHDLVADCLDKLRVGRLSQQWADGIAHQTHAADTDEDAHAQACPAIEVNAGCLRNERRHQDRSRGDDVVFGVLCRGDKRLGVDAVAQCAVERRHPKFDEHGQDKGCHRERRIRGGGGLDDFGDRLQDQVDANGANEDGDKQPCQVLVAAVAVRVPLVGRAAGKAESKQAHDVARGVGEVVEGVGDKRHGAREQARDAFGQTQGDVEPNADKARGKAGTGAAGGIDRLAFAAGNKRMYQPIYK